MYGSLFGVGCFAAGYTCMSRQGKPNRLFVITKTSLTWPHLTQAAIMSPKRPSTNHNVTACLLVALQVQNPDVFHPSHLLILCCRRHRRNRSGSRSKTSLTGNTQICKVSTFLICRMVRSTTAGQMAVSTMGSGGKGSQAVGASLCRSQVSTRHGHINMRPKLDRWSSSELGCVVFDQLPARLLNIDWPDCKLCDGRSVMNDEVAWCIWCMIQHHWW